MPNYELPHRQVSNCHLSGDSTIGNLCNDGTKHAATVECISLLSLWAMQPAGSPSVLARRSMMKPQVATPPRLQAVQGALSES